MATLTDPKIVTTYDYTDELGNLLFQVVRLEPKSFRQRHNEGGKWVWGLEGVRRVLYNLPAVIKARANKERIWIVEGEKDVDSMTAIGLCSTTNPMGSGKWLEEEYSDCLRGCDVAIIQDNDGPGKAHGQQVAQELSKRGCQVRIVELAGLGHKDDVSVWIPKHKSEAALLLNEIADCTPVFRYKTSTSETFADLNSEELILACCINDDWMLSIARDICSPLDFYFKSEYWKSLIAIQESGRKPTGYLITQELRKYPNSLSLISNIPEPGEASVAELKIAAGSVADMAGRRRMIDALKRAHILITNKDLPAGEVINQGQAEIMGVTWFPDATERFGAADLCDQLFTDMEKASRGEEIVKGLTIGFRDWDMKTDGAKPGDLGCLVAREAAGKTSFALQVASHMAFECYKSGIFFEGEMQAIQLCRRLVSMYSEVGAKSFRWGKLDNSEHLSVNRARTVITNRLQVIPAMPLTLAKIRSQCRDVKRIQGLDFCVVDYLELVEPDRRIDNERERIDYVIRQLKSLAMEFGIFVLVLSQMKRDNRDEDRPPVLSDIRGSGGVAHALDWAWGLYNHNYIERQRRPDVTFNEYQHDEVVISGLKARNDTNVSFRAWFVPAYTKFYDRPSMSDERGDAK